MTLQDFEKWFEQPIQAMNADQHGGFAVLMLTLPLAERYFRSKTGVGDGNLNASFHIAFANSFGLTQSQSEEFWQVYRNGLLHQATFSRQNRKGTIMPAGWIMGNDGTFAGIINYDSARKEFVLDPKEFSHEIIKIIRGDFSAFDSPADVKHPPLKVQVPPSYSDKQPSGFFGPLPPGSGNM